MHYGQQNCTQCPLGRACPVEGLFLPLLCPPGLACNEEGLALPYNLCKIGHICLGGVMSGTRSSMRSCTILRVIGGYDECGAGVSYKRQELDEFSAQALPAYFYERSEADEGKADACCWNYGQVADWLERIGAAIGQERAFTAYRDMVLRATVDVVQGGGAPVSAPLWDGMRLVDKAVLHHGLDATDLLEVPLRRHRDLIFLYARMMFTSHQAQLCPGGLLCLVAVNTAEVGGGISSTPYPCPSGSYCLIAADSVIGTALCPIGYYCPKETTYPRPSSPASSTENFGAVLSTEGSNLFPVYRDELGKPFLQAARL